MSLVTAHQRVNRTVITTTVLSEQVKTLFADSGIQRCIELLQCRTVHPLYSVIGIVNYYDIVYLIKNDVQEVLRELFSFCNIRHSHTEV